MAKKVLIVDDDRDIVDALELRLKRRGFDAIGETGGEGGLERAVKDRPDFIILDLMMPRMDGTTTAVSLKENERTKDIPVVFFTALISPEEESLDASKSSRIVSKLNDWDSIMDRITGYLDHSPAPSAPPAK